MPDGVDEMPWHGFYLDAYDALRYDRFYGAMGGQMPITYQAISRFAEDHGIGGEEMTIFRTFMRVIDGVHLEIAAREAESA